MRAVHHLIQQLLTLLALLGLCIGLVALLILDHEPLVTASSQLNASSLRSGQQLINQINNSINQPGTELVLQANVDDLNAAFALASRTLPGFQGQTHINDEHLVVVLSMPLKLWSTCCYINSRIFIRPAVGPLQIDKIQLGHLRVPGDLALRLISWLTDQLWGVGEGASLLAKVQSVTLANDEVTVELQKTPDFTVKDLKQKGLDLYRQWFGPKADTALIDHYYQQVLLFAEQQSQLAAAATRPPSDAIATVPPLSLTPYLQRVFQEAARRTAAAPSEGVAQRENQAAIFALALFLGGRNLQQLVHEVKTLPYAKPPKVTLARRTDLQQHFIYSATIYLLTYQQLSSTVGEAKELLDSLQGGSGFSFVDLLADKAGIRFATIASQSEHSALQLQQFFSETERQESEIFPSKSRLPEGLPQALFERDFQSIDSKDYQQMVAEIDRRLNALPLYQLSATQ